MSIRWYLTYYYGDIYYNQFPASNLTGLEKCTLWRTLKLQRCSSHHMPKYCKGQQPRRAPHIFRPLWKHQILHILIIVTFYYLNPTWAYVISVLRKSPFKYKPHTRFQEKNSCCESFVYICICAYMCICEHRQFKSTMILFYLDIYSLELLNWVQRHSILQNNCIRMIQL
jgi:hypothetical protein